MLESDAKIRTHLDERQTQQRNFAKKILEVFQKIKAKVCDNIKAHEKHSSNG